MRELFLIQRDKCKKKKMIFQRKKLIIIYNYL